MAKEWFSHDYGTRNKRKLAAMIHEEGSKGYGLFWIIVEMLYEDRNKYMEMEDFTYLAIKKESGDDMAYIREFIKKGIEVYKVFKVVKKKFFTTERVLENAKAREDFKHKKSEAGKKSAQVRAAKATGVQQVLTGVQQNLTKGNTGEEMRGDERKGDERENMSPTEFFKIEDCITIALKDKRWVKASSATMDQLADFNKYLESISEYQKNPLDYKKHFTNWKRKNDRSEQTYSYQEPKKMVM